MNEVDSQLQGAEIAAEKISAVFRGVVFLILCLAVALASLDRGANMITNVVIALYGVGALFGLITAWRGPRHEIMPYAFVTFDVILVAVQISALAGMMGMPAANVFAMPATALIFIILIHASMRYQPALVAYAAILFIVAIELGSFVSGAMFTQPGTDHMARMSATPHAGMSGLVIFRVLPPLLILMAALILFILGRRTRNLLSASITHATRTARLSRYFSPNLAAELANAETKTAVTSCRQTVAILFVDIRDFTSLGETMSPRELGALLSEYRNRLTKPIFAHGGTVDKFIGDAIMAVFGAPQTEPDDAGRAIACALDILRESERWSSDREHAGESPIQIGIGGHYGEVFAGAIGNDQLLEYTVIGDTVNVAERLERLSREIDSPLVISAALLRAAGTSAETSDWQALPPQMLKGHKQPVDAFCLKPDLR